jgi:hypothetical protein
MVGFNGSVVEPDPSSRREDWHRGVGTPLQVLFTDFPILSLQNSELENSQLKSSIKLLLK